MALNIKKAERKQVFAKIALMAASGGGKTYSSLRLAKGMAEEIEKLENREAKILMLNTEGDRGYYYADEFSYDIVDVEGNHNPEKYIKLIKEIEEAGYDILIIDSSSHEWEGKGGCLELHAQAGGKYQDWAKVTPRHQKFIDAIATCKMHVIATMRGKDQYDMSKDSNGRTSVQKLGVGAKQRDGFEYEFTCTFNIDQATSMASPQKDNTHIFDEEGAQLLTEEHGALIIDWARKGIKIETKPTSEPAPAKKTKSKKAEVEEVLESVEPVEDNMDELFEEEAVEATVDYAAELTAMFKANKDNELGSKIKSFIKDNGGKISAIPTSDLEEFYNKVAA